ncbi:MAG: TolC family protein [Bacteroidota bacterium]
MAQSINRILSITLALLLSASTALGQSAMTSTELDFESTQVFTNLDELLEYTNKHSVSLKNNAIQLDQAEKAKLAAALGTIDVTGSLLSAQFTNNTQLGVSLFPAEIFGGEPGTFQEIEMGVQYNTNLTSYADVKLVNPAGWSDLKLAKVNIDLTNSNNQLSLKQLQENVAANYYNIILIQEQISSTKQNLEVADTLYQITTQKFEEGLISQIDVNESKINYLNTEETIKQLEYLLEQYYISLKILCDIPESETIAVNESKRSPKEAIGPTVALNELNLSNSLLREEYARQNHKSAKAAMMPTLSLQLSNSYNLYNTEFEPFTGNWINSNYIGLNLSIPIPNAKRISQSSSTKYDQQMAINNTNQARNQAVLDQQTLETDYDKAVSQFEADEEVLALRKDSFVKNQQLYEEGLISLDLVLNSFNAMVNAEYSMITSAVNIELSIANININNNIR